MTTIVLTSPQFSVGLANKAVKQSCANPLRQGFAKLFRRSATAAVAAGNAIFTKSPCLLTPGPGHEHSHEQTCPGKRCGRQWAILAARIYCAIADTALTQTKCSTSEQSRHRGSTRQWLPRDATAWQPLPWHDSRPLRLNQDQTLGEHCLAANMANLAMTVTHESVVAATTNNTWQK